MCGVGCVGDVSAGWPEKASRIYFLQNDAGARRWPVTHAIIDELLDAFRPDADALAEANSAQEQRSPSPTLEELLHIAGS